MNIYHLLYLVSRTQLQLTTFMEISPYLTTHLVFKFTQISIKAYELYYFRTLFFNHFDTMNEAIFCPALLTKAKGPVS